MLKISRLKFDFIILFVIFVTILILYGVINELLDLSSRFSPSGNGFSWVIRLFINILCYSFVFLPGLILLKYFNRPDSNLSTKSGGILHYFFQKCFFSSSSSNATIGEIPLKQQKNEKAPKSFTKSFLLLIYCFCGLQGSYLIWGILQEKIMTQNYSKTKDDDGIFKDSQFLVFINRFLAFFIAWTYLLIKRIPLSSAPLYKFSFPALSNILSSWFQYEALKFVSFPTQVLSKACKIIPVMLMAKLVNPKKSHFKFYEYFTAALISLGMVLFLLNTQEEQKGSGSNSSFETNGLIILALYMAFDSFTSNYQNELFQQHRDLSSISMMAGVNLFSFILTGVSLLVQQNNFYYCISFMLNHGDFVIDCVILSVCSAIGQLYIYFTIEQFGAVVFITIMTIRQALAVLLSCIIYNHYINSIGILGILLLFFAIFLKIYCGYRLKYQKTKEKVVQTKPPLEKDYYINMPLIEAEKPPLNLIKNI